MSDMPHVPQRPRISSVTKDSFGPNRKIRTMRCFQEFDRRLRLGWTTPSLVKMIQEENGELAELSPVYVRKLVDKYRQSIPAIEMSAADPGSMISRNATKKLSKGLDEIAELNRLYEMQMQRINIDFENEKKINKLLGGTGREVYVAMKILRQSAELKMDLGLLKRNIGSVEVTGQLAVNAGERYGSEAIGKVIADPDSRRKVLGLAQRLLSIGAKSSLSAKDIIDTTATSSSEDDVGSSDDDDSVSSEE